MAKKEDKCKMKSGEKPQTLCRGSGPLKGEELAAFLDQVKGPRFYCERCHRVAAKKKFLCKPARLESRE